MAEIIRMPKMSDTMEEGVIASWLKKVGDEIKSGDILAEVETDKATMELESYDDGTLLHIGIKDGESVPVNGIIAIIGEKDEDISEILNEASSDSSNKEEEKEPLVEENIDKKDEAVKDEEINKGISDSVKEVENTENISSNGRTKASPLAKKIALEKGIDLKNVQGSGEGGRIIKKDLESIPSEDAKIPSQKIDRKSTRLNSSHQ